VKTFRFLAAERVQFLPGQYATFQFEDAPAIGATKTSPLIRTWTLSNASSAASGDVCLEISVKRKPGGRVSPWLHDYATTGFRVKVIGVDGDLTPFKLPTMPSKILLISGGIGITPNIAILRGIEKHPRSRCDWYDPDIVVLHQERVEKSLVFQKELKRLRAALTGFNKLTTLVSRSEDLQSDSDEHVQDGRLSLHLLKEQVPDAVARTVYICGPSGFMQAAIGYLNDLDVDRSAIHTEEFNF
jgi:uncharacterized protein